MKMRAVVGAVIVALNAPLHAQSASDLYQRAVLVERASGRLDSAITLYQRVVRQAGADRALAARALLGLGRAYETLGRTEARAAYERLLRDFGDQRELAAQARARIAALDPAAGRRGATGAGNAATIRQISRDPHDFAGGAVSPNGRYAAYVDRSTGDLAVLDLIAGRNRRLTNNGLDPKSRPFANYPVISPDSREIAYVWFADASGAGRSELRVVPVAGGTPRIVRLPGVSSFQLYGWAPDGEHLLALIQRAGTEIGEIALVGVDVPGMARVRNFGFTSALGASVSPDGRWIAFAVPQNDDPARAPAIHVIAVDGSGEHVLVDRPSANWGPIWAPDGQGVAFRSDRTGNESLWFQQVVAGNAVGEPILYKGDMGGVSPLGFSRDGRLFFTTTGLRDISITPIDPLSGAMVGPSRPLPGKVIGSSIDPDWSPDGQSLAYVFLRGPGEGVAQATRKLVIVNVTTGAQREFSPSLVGFQHPRWSPDGRTILLWGRGTGRLRGFFRMDLSTGAVEPLTTSSPVSPRPFEWSADGRSVFYARGDSAADPLWDGRTSIWRFDLADSAHRPVYNPDSLILGRGIAPSRDGRWLAFNASYRTAGGRLVQTPKIISLVSGELRDLPLPPSTAGELSESRAQYSDFFWLPNGTLLGTQNRTGPGGVFSSLTKFWVVPIDGSAVTRMAFESQARMVYIPRLSPDGGKFAFSVTTDDPNVGGVWTMENMLPSRVRPR